jgi:hypothetical protein
MVSARRIDRSFVDTSQRFAADRIDLGNRFNAIIKELDP